MGVWVFAKLVWAKILVNSALPTATWRHSKPIKFLQLGATSNVPSLAFYIRVSASCIMWLSKLMPLLQLVIIRIAHFIWRRPIKLLIYLLLNKVSSVGTIWSSKILIISGYKMSFPFVWFKMRLRRSKSTHLAFGPGFKFQIEGDLETYDFLLN